MSRIHWGALISLWLIPAAILAAETRDERRARAATAFEQRNYKDAYAHYRALATDRGEDPSLAGEDLTRAIACLEALSRDEEIDPLRDSAIAAHHDHWRFLLAAARTMAQGRHVGSLIGERFVRGYAGGRSVECLERDRVLALRLLDQSEAIARKEADRAQLAELHLEFVRVLLMIDSWGAELAGWKSLLLTDVGVLPDFDDDDDLDTWRSGVPVAPDGQPAFFRRPESYEAARNDGERWRWHLERAMELDPARTSEVRTIFAEFLRSQFDIEAVATSDMTDQQGHDVEDAELGPFELSSLRENQTLARLASGVQRIALPDEFNYLKIYRSIADSDRGTWGERALDSLGECFENRRQYARAAEVWREGIARYGPGKKDARSRRLAQITGVWCSFGLTHVQTAGTEATVQLIFRNARSVRFEAHELLIPRVLEDVKTYLKSLRPGMELDLKQLDRLQLGKRMLRPEGAPYVGPRVASWEQALEPRSGHFDQRILVKTPLAKAGTYLLTARPDGGEPCSIVVMVADTVIVRKPMLEGDFYFVADCRTGRPIPDAEVEFVGFHADLDSPRNTIKQIDVRTFTRTTARDGHVMVEWSALSPEFTWFASARAAGGRLAFLGFTGGWWSPRRDSSRQEPRAFLITDRPVYRPGQPVKFKCWVRPSIDDERDGQALAPREYHVKLRSSDEESVALERDFTSNRLGGFHGEFALPKHAKLGEYSVSVHADEEDPIGHVTFRVEEYRKPEFEVTVEAPSGSVRLGESFTATIRATYGFGAPVRHASVKYRVTRTRYRHVRYPKGRWDWLYGEGSGLVARHYAWPPGRRYWRAGGTGPPIVGLAGDDFRREQRLEATLGAFRDESSEGLEFIDPEANPGEVVAHGVLPIGPDGTARVMIDTRQMLRDSPDVDLSYDVTAEVVDASRRTVAGNGSVLVAARPFEAFAWLDRGYYRPGQEIVARLEARALDDTPARTRGKATLFRITYGERQEPVQEAVESWPVATDAAGDAILRLKATRPGQYRLIFLLDQEPGRTVLRECVFLVANDEFTGNDVRFDDLELIPDRREYAPGDKVRLRLNANHPVATVVLFVPGDDGEFSRPRILTLEGKSTVVELEIKKSHAPNVFIEAFTIADGKIARDFANVLVPPLKKSLHVAISPSRNVYAPGAPATVAVKLTDEEGKPFVGSVALTVYDGALDQLAGGSNVAPIQVSFWSRLRTHAPELLTTVTHRFEAMVADGQNEMAPIGVFGDGAAWGKRLQQYSFAIQTGEHELGGEDRSSSPSADIAEIQPQIRRAFADAAVWAPDLTTNKNGVAEIRFATPENLARWKLRAWGMGGGTEVGEGEAEAVTSKNLLVRIQAPRFLVQGDEVVLSANIHNDLKTDQAIRVVLELDGGTLELRDGALRSLRIDAGGEARVDWKAGVVADGEAVVRVKAFGGEESDAAEIRFPTVVHGQERTESFAGSIRPDGDVGRITFRIPESHRRSSSRGEIRFSPTLAGALVDSLPYLAGYPYGCTEQTLNRFLPTVIVQGVLQRLGLNLKAIREARTNLNAAARLGPSPRTPTAINPVFDEEKVRAMAQEGLKALAAMQLRDGGWGWFSGSGEAANAHLTALVVHGLQTARTTGTPLPAEILERGTEWLETYQRDQVGRLRNAATKTEPFRLKADNIDALLFRVLCDGGAPSTEMLGFLNRDRTELSVYGLALFGLALEKLGRNDLLPPVVHTIEQYLVKDAKNQTAYLRLPQGQQSWHWYGNDIETQAHYLKLLARTEPRGETAPALVKYLLNNRRHATYWDSTRDTALCVEAMAEYLIASGEDRPQMVLSVDVDGRRRKSVSIGPDNLHSFDNTVVLSGDDLGAGEHTVAIRRDGRGPVYYNAYISYFTLEDPIRRTGLEIKVDRKFTRIRTEALSLPRLGVRGQAATQTRFREVRDPLADPSVLKSGDVVEVELVIESKNDYEYVLVEDHKPAGFEPVDTLSGYLDDDLQPYMELRDQAVGFFLTRLPRGLSSVRYRLRAEAPGRFSALPAIAFGMYSPELRSNSDEAKVRIDD